jgi:hypothetical protein
MPTPVPGTVAAIAEAVREACVEAAIEAYEEAGIRGLCNEGRWEYAVAAVRRLDLGSLRALAEAAADPAATRPDPVKN